jgi:hypothetical protein
MLHSFPLVLGNLTVMSGAELGITIGIAGMIFGGVMGLAGMYFHHQRQRLWHETTRIALEKGQPVPVYREDHESPQRQASELRQHDLRGGLVLIAVGGGLYLFFRAVSNESVAALGYIPGLIGVALIVHWVIARAFAKRSDLPPRP